MLADDGEALRLAVRANNSVESFIRLPHRTVLLADSATEFAGDSGSGRPSTGSVEAARPPLSRRTQPRKQRRWSDGQIEPDAAIITVVVGESLVRVQRRRNLAASAPHAELDLAVFLTLAPRDCQPRLRRRATACDDTTTTGDGA